MKKSLYATEFFFIAFFFVLPVFFSNQSSTSIFENRNFLIPSFFFLFAIILYRFNYNALCVDGYIKKSIFNLRKNFFYFILTLILLLLVSFSLNFLARIFGINKVSIPVDIKLNQFIFILISIFCSAFYEEVIYRFLLPEILRIFLKVKNYVVAELFIIVLFSLGHLYLGAWACINALISGLILRVCYLKTKTIIVPFLAHFFYNSLSIIILIFSK